MKILLINNYHYLRGGSERAYFDTARILEENGHEVAFFSTKNPNNRPTAWSKYFVSDFDLEGGRLSWVQKIKAIANIFYNFEAKNNLEKLLKEFRPDVAHLHNIYHHLSPSIISVLKKNQIPTVMTLHDYKLICPNYNLFANGRIWEKSCPDKYYRCLADSCVKGSFSKTLLAVLESYLHKWLGLYARIDLFLSPSLFLIEKFKEFGFKGEIKYLPNPVFGADIKPAANVSGEKYILYYGRLSEEKGVADLLSAYGQAKTEAILKIVGSGPLDEELKNKVKLENISGVEFLGRKDGQELWNLIAGAELVVVPSRWHENAPYTIVEAMLLGKAVLAAKIGGIAELVRDGENGFTFNSGNVPELKDKLQSLLANPPLLALAGSQALETVKKNAPAVYYSGLLEAYGQVVHKTGL